MLKKIDQFKKRFNGTPLAYDHQNKESFHRCGKNLLKEIAQICGINSYDLRSNKGGIGVPGEITLHSDTIYVQIFRTQGIQFLVRSCKGRKDYRGGTNNIISINEPQRLIETIKKLA